MVLVDGFQRYGLNKFINTCTIYFLMLFHITLLGGKASNYILKNLLSLVVMIPIGYHMNVFT
jgi:hypothetical protein